MEHQRSSYRPRHRQADKVGPAPWRSAGGRGRTRQRAGFSTRSVLTLVVLASVAVGAWLPFYLGRAGADTLETASGAPVSVDTTESEPVEAASTEAGSSSGETASRSKRPAAAAPDAKSESPLPASEEPESEAPSSEASDSTEAEDGGEEAPSTLSAANETEEVVALVNSARAQAGCDPVHADAKLTSAALLHSQDMIARGYFSHNTPDGASPWDRAKESGYEVPTGENIAQGQKTAEAVMDAWMNSEGHRANILNCSSKAIGIGRAIDSGGTVYWTQMFGAE
ncbi:CAP domain-containing protein [Cryptosporangium sp. NPDC048952]|uniref:CAP domain-containing protein n=1 Tax=Cryptosporangium sp. NPDC048952 TaxID=3363961 RepID=UPI003717E0D1